MYDENRNDAGWNHPKEKKQQKGYTEPDLTVRCHFCFVGKDDCGNNVGTPLVLDTAMLMQDDKPFIALAKVGRCCRCEHIRWIRPENNVLREYDISLASLQKVLEQHRGNAFYLHELCSGKVDNSAADKYQEPAPAAVQEALPYD